MVSDELDGYIATGGPGSIQHTNSARKGPSAKPSATTTGDIDFTFGAKENGVDIAEHAGTPVELTRRHEAA